jgi:hypothetical protein
MKDIEKSILEKANKDSFDKDFLWLVRDIMISNAPKYPVLWDYLFKGLREGKGNPKAGEDFFDFTYDNRGIIYKLLGKYVNPDLKEDKFVLNNATCNYSYICGGNGDLSEKVEYANPCNKPIEVGDKAIYINPGVVPVSMRRSLSVGFIVYVEDLVEDGKYIVFRKGHDRHMLPTSAFVYYPKSWVSQGICTSTFTDKHERVIFAYVSDNINDFNFASSCLGFGDLYTVDNVEILDNKYYLRLKNIPGCMFNRDLFRPYTLED